MSGDLRERALEFFNKAHYQQEHGLFQDSLKNYLLSLDLQEKLAATDTVFNTWIATTLNNLAALLSNMGKPEEANKRYEALLEREPGNVVYQSHVAATLNNLGLFMEYQGKFPDAKKYYEKTIRKLEEPRYYMTIKAKSKAIIYLIQLISKEVEKETNILKKPGRHSSIFQ
jgi:tetratricopeptide (TPR) repeat protein